MKPGVAWLALFALAAPPAWPHAGEDHDEPRPAAAAPAGSTAPVPASVAPQRLADGSVFLPKTSQRQLALRTALAKIGEHARSVELSARVIADPNAGGRIQAAQSGRVEPGPKGLPVLGQRVRKGEVVAYVRHVEDPIERSRHQATLTELETQLEIARRRARRLEQLEGSVPQRELEAARLEAESLERRSRTIGASLTSRETLAAPVSGVISAAPAVAGQVVEARETLFEVVDPQRLLVEAIAFDASLADNLASASAAAPDGRTLKLAFVGGGRQLREQALPLLFRLEAPAPGLAVGQPLRLVAQTASRRRGVPLPGHAVVRSAAGQNIVWLHAAAERFVPRAVSFEPLDARQVLVTAGLADGDKVVVQGAASLAQVR